MAKSSCISLFALQFAKLAGARVIALSSSDEKLAHAKQLGAGYKAEIALRAVIGPMIRVQGIAVGSRARFEAMNRAIAQHKLRPVVDSTFPLEKAADALRHMEQGKHFGKIVIDI